jgi:hypothetical protein
VHTLTENTIGYFNYELVIDSFVEHFNMSYGQKEMVLAEGARTRRERAQSRMNQVFLCPMQLATAPSLARAAT